LVDSDFFDAASLEQLQETTRNAWEAICARSEICLNFEEVARLVMLMAIAGVTDQGEIVRLIVSSITESPNKATD
jgi:hypothetical protein